ncbi:MAG: deoxyribonuclease [Thermoprotei archaeon]|nr:MAG: deoxyribonuclease [Thermoprotei archaeon]
MELVITDNHLHVNPVRGRGPREVAKLFLREGGRGAVVVALLSWHYGIALRGRDDITRFYDLVVKSCDVFREVGIVAVSIVGLHPAEYTKLIQLGVKPSKAMSIMELGIEIAAEYVKSGRAVGIGEVGLPHWYVDKNTYSQLWNLLLHALTIAKDLDCVIHLHLPRDLAVVSKVGQVVKSLGLEKSRVILHHSLPEVNRPEVEFFTPSIPAKWSDLVRATRCRPVYLVESDYLDDPSRPGCVVEPWVLARRVKRLLNEGFVDFNYLDTVLRKNFEKVYRVSL